jgi:phosphatidylglycerophosphatase A
VLPFVAALTERLRERGRRRRPAPAGRPDAWTVLAAWGPCGFSPLAPGTVGTAGAVPLAWALYGLPTAGPSGAAPGWPAGWPARVAVLTAFAWLAVAAATRAGRHWREVDAPGIVIDEVVGYLVAMAFVPFGWRAALAGFALFRLFDVAKPWPVSRLDAIKTGLGVVLDDVAAGLYAGAGLWLLHRFAPGVVP